MSNVFIVLLMLATASPVFATQSIPAAGARARFGALRPSQSNPYRKLFEPPKSVGAATQNRAADTRRKVVCGMTVVQADRSIDPKMPRTPPSNTGEYTLRVIDPPICNPAR
jgi:hypothetical protein